MLTIQLLEGLLEKLLHIYVSELDLMQWFLNCSSEHNNVHRNCNENLKSLIIKIIQSKVF